MEKKFRGEIPFWLKEKENNIENECSSNRNIDDYFYVLRDFSRLLTVAEQIPFVTYHVIKINFVLF